MQTPRRLGEEPTAGRRCGAEDDVRFLFGNHPRVEKSAGSNMMLPAGLLTGTP